MADWTQRSESKMRYREYKGINHETGRVVIGGWVVVTHFWKMEGKWEPVDGLFPFKLRKC